MAEKSSLDAAVRDFYLTAARMTSPGKYAEAFDDLPRDLGELCSVVQGLLLHEHWARAYGVTLSPERLAGSHIRPVERMLAKILGDDSKPLTQTRDLQSRLVVVCRHFTVLLCTILRQQGIPARARCGFGAYFTQGRFEDHWVCEYWNRDEARWILVDAQIDAVQSRVVKPDFNLQDVPRDRFVIAGDAWRQCRTGGADPALYGIFDFRGLCFIAGNVLRDFAALNNMEMLPWDIWGPMFRSDTEVTPEKLTLFDRLAGFTLKCDESFPEIRALYDTDERIRVPTKVFNVVRNAPETV